MPLWQRNKPIGYLTGRLVQLYSWYVKNSNDIFFICPTFERTVTSRRAHGFSWGYQNKETSLYLPDSKAERSARKCDSGQWGNWGNVMTTKIKMSSLIFACASCFSGNNSGCFLLLLDRITWLQITSNWNRIDSPSADIVVADKPFKNEIGRKDQEPNNTHMRTHIIVLSHCCSDDAGRSF